ncbi:MAG: CopG family transcriptional regulator, partial [Pseudomonadota bacterium]
MTRQSITLTDPNDNWLKEQLVKQEFSSKSEAINALVRQARRADEYRTYVADKLRLSEERLEREGYSTLSAEEILEQSKAELRKNG